MQIMIDSARFSLLFRKYVDGTALPEEKLEFFALADDSKWQGQLAQLIDAELVREDNQLQLTAEEKDEILANIYKSTASEKEQVESETPRKVKLWPRIAVAAAAVAAIVFGVWLFNGNKILRDALDDKNVVAKNDIAPGKNGAVLVMANGAKVRLSDAKSGIVIGNGIKYNDNTDVIEDYVTITDDEKALIDGTYDDWVSAETAKGQTYQLTLPDGTKVWLNADSKINFSTKFSGKDRRVLLIGEAYFEVTKDAKRPFHVSTFNEDIEVLGTHFNVKAYPGEKGRKTTLLEGSIKVSDISDYGKVGEKFTRVLKPGQQATRLSYESISVENVNTEDAVAWKNGYFRFRGEQIQTIMDQLARWYDIEVVYKGKMPSDGFNGKVSRNKNISQVLKALEAMKIVHFKVEGRRVTVIN